jgi:spermidine synthase
VKQDHTNTPPEWAEILDLERSGALQRLLRRAIINPFANYFPAAFHRGLLRLLRSELAAASWADPGGWRSMVLSYQSHRRRVADKILCTLGMVPKALRNRRRMGARAMAHLIDAAGHEPVYILCLGAGPGFVVSDAMRQAHRRAEATLVDLSSEAVDFGRRLAKESGIADRVRFILGDVREVAPRLDHAPDLVKMLGICEYLSDEQLTAILQALYRAMPAGASVVSNSMTPAHGVDRYFRRVLNLKIIHRTPEVLSRFFRDAGFSEITSHGEPLGIFHILIARKVK